MKEINTKTEREGESRRGLQVHSPGIDQTDRIQPQHWSRVTTSIYD